MHGKWPMWGNSSPRHQKAFWSANPPYGVRLDEAQRLAAWYPRLGDALKRHWTGWRAWIATADPELPRAIGLKASRRVPLFNGGILRSGVIIMFLIDDQGIIKKGEIYSRCNCFRPL